MNTRALIALALSCLTATAFAQAPADQAAKPHISATQQVQLTATVEAIDHATRTVTLRGPEGKTRTIQVGEEARNLPQVKVGDVVVADLVQELDIQVLADDGSELGAGVMAATGRAEEGQMPGAMAVETAVITAHVNAINLENNTFKLEWADGSIEEFTAQNPDNLRRAAVGDLVVITYTEGLALSVQRPDAATE